MAEILPSIAPFVVALAGGILPALLWLRFWLKQDRACPEPTGLIALSFAAGMAVVFFVLPLQKLVVALLPLIMNGVDALAVALSSATPSPETVQTVLWSFIEEFGKFATVFLVAYQSKNFDEPKDAVIYLITAALGFAAMENSLYLLKDIIQSGGMQALLDSQLRFLGATTVHVASSGALGVAFAFAFYRPFWEQFMVGMLGISLATLLHTYFNLSIMKATGMVGSLGVFTEFWGMIVVIIILLAVIGRTIKPKKTCNL